MSKITFTIACMIIIMNIPMLSITRPIIVPLIRIKTWNPTSWWCIHKVLLDLNSTFPHNRNQSINIKHLIPLFILIYIPICPPMHHVFSFIIQHPIDNRRMMLKSTCLLPNLYFWILNKFWVFKWIKLATKHHILPYHDAHLICKVVEIIVHVHPSSPDANDIKISLACWQY